ncbi:MAG: AmmeMemoRadiSam system protein B [Patescibacteria group bacterium]
MPLLISALLPHSPLLIPEIGRANYDFLAKTVAAYQEIETELKTQEINTLIIISPHGLKQETAFTLNVAPEMSINLQDFGFIPPKTIFNGDALLADQIQKTLRPDFSLQLISEEILDYGSAIPLYLFKSLLNKIKIITIYPASDLNDETQFKFGQALKIVLENSDKKIALIASGDLSHRLKKKSPGGYSPKGAKFDNKLIEFLSVAETAAENILTMDTKLIKDAGECGLHPLLILLGAITSRTRQSQLLAYQTDFGIGYLSFNFKLN